MTSNFLSAGTVPPGADGDAGVPSSRVANLEPYEVEAGDILDHLRTPIASLLLDDRGVWHYYDIDGVLVARRPHWAKVTVHRPNPSTGEPPSGAVDGSAGSRTPLVLSGATSQDDWCEPLGIPRWLQ